jgi:hypothetical protein
MSTGYPITARRHLEKADKTKWFRRPERESTDLLQPDAHHVLVYRIDGNYVLDSDRMNGTDERVVQATHVSLVDMRRDAPVVVRLEIPSQDAASFEVLVTFICTVTDAIAVVRGGVEAQQALESHLKAHNRIFELGLDYPLAAINEVRRVVSAQVKAYLTIRPPSVPGMTVSVASVEMTSPDVLAGYEKSQREKDYEARLAEMDLEYQRRLALSRQFNEHTLADERQNHEEKQSGRIRRNVRTEAVAQASHEETLTVQANRRRRAESQADAQHDQLLAGERSAFARKEFGLNMETIGHDPRRALLAAFADGRIDAPALSDQLRQLDDQDRIAQIEDAQRQREEALQLLTADRDDRYRTEEVKQKREEREHAEKLRKLDQDREDRLEREHNDRADRLNKEEADRLAEQQERQRQFELLKTMTAQGHFNNSDMQGERLLATVMNLPQPEVDSAGKPVLPGEEPAGQIGDAEHQDPEMREEDV